ncbi:adenylyltransferase/cytidyltransferase family protein [Sphingobacterium siyangense]|jgi:glycerol-3-phosphate cytidylyltransferase|uniref:Adenylyltransferase/cytidyltransferase family protein n=2 Tax=Sphingobacterium TaxID=28453 RepID=A0ACD5BWN3_9SPHI|nr:adenylyltransferase/cytidyltransferase family protein [Sphingobacterium multivorum]VXC32812.1 Glycerol-3-phosphate cytidylyltransferase [Sphingobacterium multivorum]HAE66806.1 glycerol-3-phosphate cytidylyltransferase [Sphingobacterium sp.]
MKIGITFGVFDLLHAGHIMMLEEAKHHCDYLIVGLNTDPSEVSPEKAKPTQTIVERYIQLEGCRYVDEIIPYETEQDLIDMIKALPINLRIIGEEYRDADFTGKKYCVEEGIDIYYNKRTHRFSSAQLRRVVYEKETTKK